VQAWPTGRWRRSASAWGVRRAPGRPRCCRLLGWCGRCRSDRHRSLDGFSSPPLTIYVALSPARVTFSSFLSRCPTAVDSALLLLGSVGSCMRTAFPSTPSLLPGAARPSGRQASGGGCRLPLRSIDLCAGRYHELSEPCFFLFPVGPREHCSRVLLLAAASLRPTTTRFTETGAGRRGCMRAGREQRLSAGTAGGDAMDGTHGQSCRLGATAVCRAAPLVFLRALIAQRSRWGLV